MQVSLEAIKFNHDPDSATSDALNIRRNETEFVTVPEWRKGLSILPDDSPAVYAIHEIGQRQITIQARFKSLDTKIKTVEIRAVDPTSNLNALGEVVPRKISFDSSGETQFETFELEGVDFEKRGVSSSVITWIWQYRIENSDWCLFATTRHRIYTILGLPKCAWVQQPFDGRNPQLLWTEVLDYACEWAHGARDVDEAAAKITQAVFDLGRSVVAYDSGPCYANRTFDCASFLSLLRDDKGMGQRFNCTDCATIVSSFANALGSDLWQSQIGRNFTTHPIRLIGASSFVPELFRFHEVAWKGACSFENDLFDACMELDGDDDPSKCPHTGVLGIQTEFGTAQVGTYRFRLSPLPPYDRPDPCQPTPAKRRRRPIGLNSQPASECTAESSELRDSGEHQSVDDGMSIDPHLFESSVKIGLWEIYRVRYLKAPNLVFGAYSLWFLPNGDPEHLIRADLYQFVSAEAANLEKQRLLDRYQIRSEQEALQRNITAIDFSPVTDTASLAQVGGFIVEVRSVGRKKIPLQEFITGLNNHLNRPVSSAAQNIGQINGHDT